ncbi:MULTISPECIES: hypothetical protein [Enterococcus]|uniref:hypothetical protein n=1 Tax=Enterococcus TaxID=1350 RepID=UPI0010F913DA|nr:MULTISPECIES: hypothetical protein [Enterococcus]KAF1301140.1 hypothetical protein BAU16_10395 [Enterococcus sp. JM9B]
MAYFKTLFLINRHNIKYQFLLALTILFTFIQIGNTVSQNRPFLLEENSAARQAVQSILSQFKKIDPSEQETQKDPLYFNLIQQSELLARKEQALLFENWKLLNEASLELVEVRESFLTLPGSKKYQSYLPTLAENQLEKTFFQKIQKDHIPLITENSTLVMAMISLIVSLGFLWFPLNALISSDLLLEEMNHLSVTNGYPISFRKRILLKISFLFGIFLLVLFLILLLAGIMGIFSPIGSLCYPVPIYIQNYQTVPFWLYLFLIIGYLLMLTLFTTLLSLSLNYLLNNLYITIFTSFGLYLLPYFFPNFMKSLWFLPSIFLNPVQLLQGEFLKETFLSGIGVLATWCLFFITFLSRVLNAQKLKERRHR